MEIEYLYNNYAKHFKSLFDHRVQKLSINAGFTCPNRDGTKSVGGCTFCNNEAFNPSYCSPAKSITQQIQEGKAFHQGRYKRAFSYLAYFQAYSNTYAPLETLKAYYEEALSDPEVIGLVIGTRCDCLDEDKLLYISDLSKKYYIVLEIGIESCYDDTLHYINRGHTYDETSKVIQRAAELGIRVGAHLIFGLPGDTRERILNQVDKINKLPLYSIKFHQLQIIQGTYMEKQYEMYKEGNQLNMDFNPLFFELGDYIDLVIDVLERLNPDIIIERIAGEVPPRFQKGPSWGLIRNDQIMNRLNTRLKERSTFQGRLYKPTIE